MVTALQALIFSDFRYVYIANSQVTTDIVLSVEPKYVDLN